MNSVVHFELPFEDQGRAVRFYERAFEWKTEALGEAMGHYVLATTIESDEKGPVRPGAINGGLYPRQPEGARHPSLVLAVNDITESMRKVREAGGRVEGEPVELAGVGLYVSFVDTEGNRMSMLQPTAMGNSGR